MVEKKYDIMEFMPDYFHYRDNGLGELALMAAVSINSYGRDTSTDIRPVIRLGRIMQVSTQSDEDCPYESGGIPLKDDINLGCFMYDVFSSLGKRYETADEIIEETKKISLSLLDFQRSDRNQRKDLIDFCTNLSQKAESWWHWENPNGFRKYIA